MRNLGLLFSFVITLCLGGCSSFYPKQSENLIQAPIKFSLKNVSDPSLSKEDVLTRVKSRLQNGGLLNDKFVVQAVDKKAPIAYDDLMKSQSIDPSEQIKMISSGLNNLLSSGAGDKYFFDRNYGSPRFNYNQVSFVPLPNNGFELKGRYNSGKFSYSLKGQSQTFHYNSNATMDILIVGDYAFKDGVTTGNISKIQYLLNCVDTDDNKPEILKVVLANERGIVNQIQNLSAYSKQNEVDVVNTVENRMKNIISKRYTRSVGYGVNKVEKKYPVDFATAKARLQRALGEFKYDNNLSTFTFDKDFTKNNINVTHKFSFSLFPDKSATVVQFSGDYSYLTDALEGPELFGSTEYNEQMNKYIANIGNLLNK